MKYVALLVLVGCNAAGPTGGGADRGTRVGSAAISVKESNSYEPVDLDSLATQVLVPVGNDRYPLRITQQSANDSAVIDTVEMHGRLRISKVIPHRHDRTYRVRFNFGGRQLDTLITKELFQDTLGQRYADAAVMVGCRFEFVRSNTLHFTASFRRSSGEGVRQVSFSIFYRGNKFGVIYGIIPREDEGGVIRGAQ